LECLIALAIIMFLLVLVPLTFGQLGTRTRIWNQSFNSLARKYGGQARPAGLFGRPSADFRYGTTACHLSNVNSPKGAATQLLIQWPDSRFRMELTESRQARPQGFWGNLSGLKAYLDADHVFNQRYQVVTNDELTIGSMLSSGVRWKIDSLYQLLNTNEVSIQVARGTLIIRKLSFIKDYRQLDRFTRLCLEFYDQVMLTRSVGIDFVNDDTTKLLDEVVCQICGDVIRVDMVFCASCKTPHCLECWEYYGQCSTFACGETQYVTPRIATPQIIEQDEIDEHSG
jgi:hypothetical protein